MPGESTALAEVARVLWCAERDRTPVAPISDTNPTFGSSEAYAVARINVARRIEAGSVLRGRKIGLTSRASQAMLGVGEPTFGALLSDMFVDDDDRLATDDLLQPRVEAELAFVLATDLVGPGVNTVTAMRAVDRVIPVIEVGDSRIADWRIRISDTIADNASSARVVLGPGFAHLTDELDLIHLGVLFSRNGVPIDSGAGAAVLGNPLRAVAWLANKLADYGESLRAGDIVLSGALHRMVPVRPGDEFRAEFAHLGSVGIRFTGESS